ncbi:hypothetical protein [Yoonia sp. MH D7]
MKFTTLLAALVCAGTSASAQDIYAGVALDYGLPHSGDAQTAASLLVGGSYSLGTMAIAGEAEYGAAATFGGDYDTARLRLIGSYDFGSVTALASLGGTYYDAGADTFTGYNFGVGAQMPITGALDIRGEIMRDMMDDYGTNVTTTRLAAIYTF